MEHILDEFYLGDEILVENVTKREDNPPQNWVTFHDFPRKRGWALDQNYKLVLDENRKQRVPLDKNRKPNPQEELPPPLGRFLQAWLFFGLIFTIVQVDGEPVLKYDQLTKDGTYVTTEDLKVALGKWHEWECAHPDGIRLRMIRIEKVLDIARRTVRQQCTYNEESAHLHTSSGDQLYMSDQVSLSLMVLGETLSAAKANIMEKTNSELRGWHQNDGEGWGQPRYVWFKMRDWCPRTKHLWRSQLRSNATLLLASYCAYRNTDKFKGPNHKGRNGINGQEDRPECDQNNCYVTSEDEHGQYQSAHSANCPGLCGIPVGPDMNQVMEHLRNSQIPLLRFQASSEHPENLEFTVLQWVPRDQGEEPMKYATISHVWSDGFGNQIENKLYPCQLRFIRNQLSNVDKDSKYDLPFWMDTLLIPVERAYTNLRKTAIGQIFNVFEQSSFTIVLDGGLSGMSPGKEDKPGHTAMRILASSWMRRLWTLQEAFLSKQIHFAFQEDGLPGNNLREFSLISEKLKEGSSTSITTVLLSMVNEHMRHHIMDNERKTRDEYMFARVNTPSQRKTAVLVANAWRAARWRTTTNPFHETLALAALLNLDYQNTSIETAGLQLLPLLRRGVKNGPEKQAKEKDDLMTEFWTQFNERWPDSIPPGIIFLPGDRIDIPGFGWAPRTWMSAQPLDPPDPLSIMDFTAKLDLTESKHGLKVRYPGFLLEAQNRRLLLSTDKQDNRFWFPTGPHFLDWYVVAPADNAKETTKTFMPDFLKSKRQLAIIISRPKPSDAPAEIGLLVQVRDIPGGADKQGGQGKDTPSGERDDRGDESEKVLYCEIVHRVKVSRETRPVFYNKNQGRFFKDYEPPKPSQTEDGNSQGETKNVPRATVGRDQPERIPEVMADPSSDSDICLAEELDRNQVWYVDGYFPDRKIPDISTENPSAPSGKESKSVLRRFFGGGGRPALASDQPPAPPRRVGTVAESSTSQARDAPEAIGITRWLTGLGGDKKK